MHIVKRVAMTILISSGLLLGIVGPIFFLLSLPA